jgi:NAD(P)H-hydrate repair Nnr-like enzyme with NAD(P)H-hydrate dehydratase domain
VCGERLSIWLLVEQVTPVYSAKWPGGVEAGVEDMVALVVSMLPRLHSLVIGPGLGRDDAVLDAVAQIITAARERGLPMVIDADGLFLITQVFDLSETSQRCAHTLLLACWLAGLLAAGLEAAVTIVLELASPAL